jgi:hypothetical protein
MKKIAVFCHGRVHGQPTSAPWLAADALFDTYDFDKSTDPHYVRDMRDKWDYRRLPRYDIILASFCPQCLYESHILGHARALLKKKNGTLIINVIAGKKRTRRGQRIDVFERTFPGFTVIRTVTQSVYKSKGNLYTVYLRLAKGKS